MLKLSAGIAVVGLLLTTTVTAATFHFDYLVAATNRVADTLAEEDSRVSEADRLAAAGQACSALQQLVADPQLHEVMKQAEYARTSSATRQTLNQVYARLGVLNQFISVEADKLSSAGYDPAATAQIIGQMSFGLRPHDVQERDLYKVVEDLRDRVCDISKQTAVNDEDFVSIALGLAGIALVGVDTFVPGMEPFSGPSDEAGVDLLFGAAGRLSLNKA
jgi:hypothetical protein